MRFSVMNWTTKGATSIQYTEIQTVNFSGAAFCDSASSAPACCIKSPIDFSKLSIRTPISSILVIIFPDISSNRPCICCKRFCTNAVSSSVPRPGAEDTGTFGGILKKKKKR